MRDGFVLSFLSPENGCGLYVLENTNAVPDQ